MKFFNEIFPGFKNNIAEQVIYNNQLTMYCEKLWEIS